MKIDRMETGKEYWEGKKEKIEAICSSMEWQKLPCEMSSMGGEAIKETIKGFKIRKPSHVGESNAMAPFGLIGIKASYSNADISLFAVDDGLAVSPICIFVNDK